MAAKKKATAKRKAAVKKSAAVEETVRKRNAAPRQRIAAKKKAAARKTPAAGKKTARRRELLDTGTNKLFVRRNERGTSFEKLVDAGKSITRDKRTKAKRKVPSGQGDKGDRR